MLTKQSIIEIADKLKEKTSFLWSVANLDISDSEKERLKEQLCQKMIVDIDDFMKNKLEEEDQQDDEECDCEHCKGYESFRKLIDQSCDASRVVDNPEEVMKNLLSSIKKIIQ